MDDNLVACKILWLWSVGEVVLASSFWGFISSSAADCWSRSWILRFWDDCFSSLNSFVIFCFDCLAFCKSSASFAFCAWSSRVWSSNVDDFCLSSSYDFSKVLSLYFIAVYFCWSGCYFYAVEEVKISFSSIMFYFCIVFSFSLMLFSVSVTFFCNAYVSIFNLDSVSESFCANVASKRLIASYLCLSNSAFLRLRSLSRWESCFAF